MKICLEGTRAEIEAVLFEMPSILEIRRVSDFYPHPHSDRLFRRYVTVIPPVPDHPVT